MNYRHGLPVILSEHVPKGMTFVFGDPGQAVAVDHLTEVERWMATPPRQHARRIVAEVIGEHRRREQRWADMAEFRASVLMELRLKAEYSFPTL